MYSRTELRERFHQLAADAEYQLSVAPLSYKRKLLLLGILGYSVIGLLLTLVLAAIGGTIWLATLGTVLLIMLLKSKLIFVLLAALWFLFKAIWIRLLPPEGDLLTKTDYPELWQQVQLLQETLGTPAIHRIVLVPEMNAAIAQTPRLGLFGWQQNTLVLGLELLLALSAEEGKAVLAHELGHLSGTHCRFNSWIYRMRQSWQQIDDSLQQQQSIVTLPLRRFFTWYALTFNGYSFALARHNEYEADQISAKLTSTQHAGSALCYSRLLADAIQQEFWQPLWRNAEQHSSPPPNSYQQLAEFLVQRRQSAGAAELQQAMQESASPDDTHPSLRQRLQALKHNKVLLLPAEKTAAQALLGNRLQALLQQYGEQWQQAVAPNWLQQHEHHLHLTEQLAAVNAVEPTNYTLEQALLWLELTTEQGEDSQPLETVRQLQQRFTDNADLAFVLACRVQQSEPQLAKSLLQQACDDFSLREQALLQLLQLAEHQHDTAAGERWQLALDQHYDQCDQLNYRWNNLKADDSIKQAILTAKQQGLIQNVLAQLPAIKSALIVQRVLPNEISAPAYILYVSPHWYRNNSERLLQKVADKLGKQLTVFVINKDFAHKALLKKIKRLGQQIYPA